MTDHPAGCAKSPHGNHVSSTEIAWMARALARPCLDTGTFRALTGLLEAWPDGKVLALAQHIDPSLKPRDRVAARAAIARQFQARLRLCDELTLLLPAMLRAGN